MIKTRSIFLILFICLLCFCSQKKDQQSGVVTLSFWHSFVSSTIPALTDLINKFEQENPGIKIRTQYVPTGEALIQKLITAIQSKTAPDISWIHSFYMENLVKADAIYAMKDFINDPNGITAEDLNDIYPPLIQMASWRNTMYSMPMEATNLALLYNKDMYRAAKLDPEKPPQDWDELYQFARKLTLDTNNDGKFEQIGFFVPIYPAAGPQGLWMVWQFSPFLWQAGGYMIDESQTKILYNSDAGVAALSLWKKMYDEFKLNMFTTDFDVAFASKHLAMAMDGPWSLPRYKELMKNLDWAFAPLPQGPHKKATIIAGEFLAIFKQSSHPREAWTFLKWMIRPDVQAFWAMKSGYLPIRRAVKNISEFQNYLQQEPNFRVFVDQLDVGEAERPMDFGGIEIQQSLAEAIEKATVGKMAVPIVLNEGVLKAQAVLDSYKQAAAK